MFPNRVMSRWPAIIFAISRIDNDIGRIIFPVVSIIIIIGIIIEGVPVGKRCINIKLVWLIHPNIIIDIHIGNASDIVKQIWLVDVKLYGNRPIMLFNIIIKNIAVEIIRISLCWVMFFISSMIFFSIISFVILILEFFIQKFIGKIIVDKIIIIQFNW